MRLNFRIVLKKIQYLLGKFFKRKKEEHTDSDHQEVFDIYGPGFREVVAFVYNHLGELFVLTMVGGVVEDIIPYDRFIYSLRIYIDRAFSRYVRNFMHLFDVWCSMNSDNTSCYLVVNVYFLDGLPLPEEVAKAEEFLKVTFPGVSFKFEYQSISKNNATKTYNWWEV